MQTFEGPRDVGVDAVVQDMQGGHARPTQFNLQIRTSEHFAKTRTGFTVPISPEHRSLWSGGNVPLVLVCVDAGSAEKTEAFWRLIEPADAEGGSIVVSRAKRFGPTSRGQVLAEMCRAIPRELPPLKSALLPSPLQIGVRQSAKAWYRANLMPQSVHMPDFGAVVFTWHGWRHITRRRNSCTQIRNALSLLPAARSILAERQLPTGCRTLPTIERGRFEYHRCLLFFERGVRFTDRSSAKVQVIVKQLDRLPVNWRDRPPDATERRRVTLFYDIKELPERTTKPGADYQTS